MLSAVALLVMGLPVLYVLCSIVLVWLSTVFGWSIGGTRAALLACGMAAILLVPMGWLASRVGLEGVAVRPRLLRGWAQAHGWSTDTDVDAFEERWSSPHFGTTRSQVCNLVSRSDQRGMVWSLTYVSDDVPRHVVLAETSPHAHWLRLTPERLVDRAAGASAPRDLDTEWGAFNDHWRVESDDPRFAYAVLQPRMMERLMAPDTRETSVLFERGDIVVHTPGRTVLERIEPMANLVLDLAALLPGFVVQDNPPLPQGTTRREVMALRADRRRSGA